MRPDLLDLSALCCDLLLEALDVARAVVVPQLGFGTTKGGYAEIVLDLADGDLAADAARVGNVFSILLGLLGVRAGTGADFLTLLKERERET